MSTTLTPFTTSTPPQWEGVSAPKRALWRTQGFLSRHRDLLIVLALMVVAVAIRAYMTRGLWLDEATTVAQAKMSFGRMLSYLRESDVHPPLHQIIMWADLRVFGDSKFAVRLPSLVLGTALVPVIYGLGREMFGRRTALIAAFGAAIGPAAVWYSQEARMYPLFMLLAAITLWAQVRCVRSGSWKAWAVYSVATAALLWTHYFALLHILVQQLAFLVLMWQRRSTPQGRRLIGGWIRSVLVVALLVAPLSIMPIAQIENYGDRDTVTVQSNGSVASGAPIYTAISNLASAMFGYHSTSTMTKINALWPLGMLAALLALGRGRSRQTALLGAVVVIPMIVLFIVGLKRNDVFELRYFAGAVPALTLLAARAITLVTKKRITTAIAVGLMGITLGTALVAEQADGGNARVYDFEGALTELNDIQQPGDLMLYEPFYLHPTVNYYAPKYTSYPLVAGLQSTTAPKRIVVVGSLAFAERDRSRQRLDTVVSRLQRDRRLDQHLVRNNIEVWVFS